MWYFQGCFILLSMSLVWCLRFDYYKKDNPVPRERRTSVGNEKNDQGSYFLAGFKNKQGHEKDAHKATAEKGHQDKENFKKDYGVDGGHTGEKHSERIDENAHKAETQSQKGAKFAQKKGHKKGHKTKGWHNTFFRDEYHKEHRFYDDAHKSGEYETHGAAHENFHKARGGTKRGSQQKSKHVDRKKGKKGRYNSGHNNEEHRGYVDKKGDEKTHGQLEKHAKQSKGKSGKHFVFTEEH